MSEKQSSPGVYRGHVERVADGYQRSSLYVAVQDGLRLAVDVLLPASGGVPLKGPFPVGLVATGYRRAWRKGEREFGTAVALQAIAHLEPGSTVTAYEYNGVARSLIQHGYAVVVVDVRGTGASFGVPYGSMIWQLGAEIGAVVDWAGRQPWSTGRVGMFGASWLGMNCLTAAAARPESLACIAPYVPPSPYNSMMMNGLLMHGFTTDWSDMRQGQDTVEQALPIDGPDGEALLEAALKERAAPTYLRLSDNRYTLDRFEANMGRHAEQLADPVTGRLGGLLTEFQRLNEAGVPVYFVTGWWDLAYVDDTISLFNALTVPRRLLLGPWNHSSYSATVETLRWFDYWLRDVPNGITDEPEVTFGSWSAAGDVVWRQTPRWPVSEAVDERCYLQPGPSGDASGGTLSPRRAVPTETIDYTVDYEATTGLQSRHRHLYRTVPMHFPDLAERDRRCATWTSEPFEEAIEIAGTAVVHLRLESSAPAGGLVCVLEEVTADGSVRYVTEGVLNLEDRALAAPPFPRASGVWHPVESDLRQPLPVGEPVDVAFELFCVAWRIERGHRLRLALAGADRDNYTVPSREPRPVLTFHSGGPRPSHLQLPVVRAGVERSGAELPNAFEDDPIVAPFIQTVSGGAGSVED